MTIALAGSMRAGLISAAVALLLVGTLAARADDVPAEKQADKNPSATAAEQTKTKPEPDEASAGSKPADAKAAKDGDDDAVADAKAAKDDDGEATADAKAAKDDDGEATADAKAAKDGDDDPVADAKAAKDDDDDAVADAKAAKDGDNDDDAVADAKAAKNDDGEATADAKAAKDGDDDAVADAKAAKDDDGEAMADAKAEKDDGDDASADVEAAVKPSSKSDEAAAADAGKPSSEENSQADTKSAESEPAKEPDETEAVADKQAGDDEADKTASSEQEEKSEPEKAAAKADDEPSSQTDKADKADSAAADASETTVKAADDDMVEPPSETAALPEAAAEETGDGVADPVLPPADAILALVRSKIPAALRNVNEHDATALTRFYEELNGEAIWASTAGLTEKGEAVVAEIKKADDWGLPAASFRLPLVRGTLTEEAAADAELQIAKAVLKYARYARGGRLNPKSISKLYDHTPMLRAPKAVLIEISASSQPDAYLRALHPQHAQFHKLRKVLLKLRGSDGKELEPKEDPALSVKLPPGRLIRAGMDDPQVALLRQRLKVPAVDEVSETLYDKELQDAVKRFQRARGLRPDAIIGNNTRAALNGRPKRQPPTTDSKIRRVLINMERWRWLPEDLGEFHVWDNVPEFRTRIVKNGEVIHADKIIVGQPSWPTPAFSADMKTIVFNPQWGVPNGIKTKELWPLLRKSSGAGFFGIFGGGYSSQAVLDAHDLRVSYNGRPINPNQVDWKNVDIRRYSFVQPPGPKNVLGTVKFMFPNKHDVYMHDTPERHLFAKSFRALSHGCLRVGQPRRLAEILLAQDKGWSAARVRSMFGGGYSNTVALDTHIPVHVTYMTARVDDNGKLRTYGDFYGLDSRTSAALTGKSVRVEQPVYADEAPVASGAPQRQPRKKQQQYGGPPTLADAINNLFSP